MNKKYIFRQHQLRRLVSLLIALIVVVLFLTHFNKIPRLVKKMPRLEESTVETITSTISSIKWSLTPSIFVKINDGASTKVLPKLRLALASKPLRVSSTNTRYFASDNGKVIFLAGSHTWDNRQDMGTNIFDYARYLNLLQQYNHNFIRFWVWEQPKGITTWPDPAKPLDSLTPEIFVRIGPAMASDGNFKFDVTKYNAAHFDRLRQRVIEAGNRGIYVSLMLFNGWSVKKKAGGANPWVYHPFNKSNNINGIDGDPNNDQSGAETHSLQIPAVTQVQEAYIRKVIDTVNDLDNVLYEISNESDSDSQSWQYHMINYIKNYEGTKPKQHPVGMTATFPNGSNDSLFDSPADWVSPTDQDGSYKDNIPSTEGKKVIISDTDHLWGIGGDRVWAWKSFTRGLNLLYMDPWDGQFIPVKSNSDLRANLGYIVTFASQMNLAKMIPQGSLSSTGYCLANTMPPESEYLIYSPSGGNVKVNLSSAMGVLSVEWFNPSNGLITGGTKTIGGGTRTFVPPFNGDAILYIRSNSPS